MKKTIFFIAAILMVLVSIYGYLTYNKKHGDALQLSPDFKLTAVDLFDQYAEDEDSANERYLGKLLEVEGSVSDIENDETSLKIYLFTGDRTSSIQCEFEQNLNVANLEVGRILTVRGFCSGKLLDIVLNRCVLIE